MDGWEQAVACDCNNTTAMCPHCTVMHATVSVPSVFVWKWGVLRVCMVLRMSLGGGLGVCVCAYVASLE